MVFGHVLANKWIFALYVLGLGAMLAGAAEPATPLPRYRLQLGQELVYRVKDEFKYQNGSLLTDVSWNVWVVRANPDGSWRLVLRRAASLTQAPGRRSTQQDVRFAYCDLFPDGRILENESCGFQMKPQEILPRLPHDATEAGKGWIARNEGMDVVTRYRLLDKPLVADRCAIEAIDESGMDMIYGLANRAVITFDKKRGLPEKTELTRKQTSGFNGQGQGTATLEEVKTHDGSWCREFAAETNRYFAAYAKYQQATLARKTVAETKTALEQGEARLRAVREEFQQTELQEQIDELLAQHARMSKHYVQEAENRAAVLDKPAADWSTTDLAGKPVALKDCRGKVVILDFWYRGCGWCIRSMPQMKQVAAHFKGQPVVVFGMNTDRKLSDATFVVDKMGLNYSNLKATGLPEKYKVRGFPTLLIIDQEGIVRDVHVGYSPTLKKEVIESVTKLLKPKS